MKHRYILHRKVAGNWNRVYHSTHDGQLTYAVLVDTYSETIAYMNEACKPDYKWIKED